MKKIVVTGRRTIAAFLSSCLLMTILSACDRNTAISSMGDEDMIKSSSGDVSLVSEEASSSETVSSETTSVAKVSSNNVSSIKPTISSSKNIASKENVSSNMSESQYYDYTQLDYDAYTTPYWKGNVMYHESLTFVDNGSGVIEASLMFTPTKIISVRSSSLSLQYVQGKDYEVVGKKIRLLKNSNIPTVDEKELFPDTGTFPRIGGGYVAGFGSELISQQVAVTYEHSQQWAGPVPEYAESKLPKTLAKLKNKERLKLVFIGDSITVGGNTSGAVGCQPYMPNWPVLLKTKLEQEYGGTIEYVNNAVNGSTSYQGVQDIKKLAIDENPDLLVIAYGMNDGQGVPGTEYAANLSKMMNAVQAYCPKCEFILVTPVLPSREAMFPGNPPTPVFKTHLEMPAAAKKLEKVGVALCDVTNICVYIEQYKRYIDVTGGGINHPNDFMARVYAQALCCMLIKDFR